MKKNRIGTNLFSIYLIFIKNITKNNWKREFYEL